MPTTCNQRTCTHSPYRPGGGHCADMPCPNYVNKCPAHNIPRQIHNALTGAR